MAFLQQLQHSLGHSRLNNEAITYLMLFIFRPFLPHLLTNTSSMTASCTLAVVQLLAHALQYMASYLSQPSLQKQQDTLTGHMLTDLAACHFYSRDPFAAKWLSSPRPASDGLQSYIRNNSNCPKKPLPTADGAAADSESAGKQPGSNSRDTSGDSAVTGLQALLDLLSYASGNTSKSLDSVLMLLQHLVAPGSCGMGGKLQLPVSAALSSLNLQPLWVHWLTPRTIQGIQLSGPGSSSAEASIKGAVGAESFDLGIVLASSKASAGGSRVQAVDATVTWADQSTQHITGQTVPPRLPPTPVVLGLLSGCNADQMAHCLQQLSGELLQLCYPDSSSDANKQLQQQQQQQHVVQCILQLVMFAAGLGDRTQQDAASASTEQLSRSGNAVLLSAVLSLVQGMDEDVTMASSLPVKQCLMCELGLLLHQPLKDAVVPDLLGTLNSSWPLRHERLRVRWLGLQPLLDGTSQHSDLLNVLPTLPCQQQTAVLRLLITSVQSFPGDVMQLAPQQVLSVLLELLVSKGNRLEHSVGKGINNSSTMMLQSSSKLVAEVDSAAEGDRSGVLQQLADLVPLVDTGSGRLYSLLNQHLDKPVTESVDSTAGITAQHADDIIEQQQQQQQQSRLAVLQLLQIGLSNPQDRNAVAAAAHSLLQQASTATAAVEALVGLLWWHCDMLLSMEPVLELLMEVTGAGASSTLLLPLQHVAIAVLCAC